MENNIEIFEDNNLVQILIKKGYDKLSALKCVQDVLSAKKEARVLDLKKYVGKRVKTTLEGMQFEVVIHDIKINIDGKTEWQVTPVNGSKKAWVKGINL